ncbi:MAG: hypothetical protein H0V42_10140, partial [Nocardioidaceae bacterium]|nr:hypothetical protein [Nocardioidaceae bacterium]
VNAELVELSPVEAAAAVELKGVVRRHLQETGSPVAEKLLGDWAGAVRRFTEVMPTDFKRVLTARTAAEAAGLSEDETSLKMMEALHG